MNGTINEANPLSAEREKFGASPKPGLLCLIFLSALTLAFIRPIAALVKYASDSELYSHIFLVPLISVYFLWPSIKSGFIGETATQRKFAAAPAVLGGLLLVFYSILLGRPPGLVEIDRLSFIMGAYVCFVYSGIIAILGIENLKKNLFAYGFLLFLIPMPQWLTQWLEAWLQHCTADLFQIMLAITQTPVFRNGLEFILPGLSLEIAPQCSGLRSTFVLFIAALIAGKMFLKTQKRRILLVVAAWAIGIVRNGLRILAISMLSIHVNPKAIDGPIHHQGGPPFFLLSLIPLFAFLYFFRKSEARKTEDGQRAEDGGKKTENGERGAED